MSFWFFKVNCSIGNDIKTTITNILPFEIIENTFYQIWKKWNLFLSNLSFMCCVLYAIIRLLFALVFLPWSCKIDSDFEYIFCIFRLSSKEGDKKKQGICVLTMTLARFCHAWLWVHTINLGKCEPLSFSIIYIYICKSFSIFVICVFE